MDNNRNYKPIRTKITTHFPHDWDEDGCCIHCNFDGVEWHHWKHNTYEGRAQPDAKMPLCKQERKLYE